MNSISPRILLYCFPYAGGTADIYRDWSRYFPDDILVRPMELPGHGARRSEPLIVDYRKMVDVLVREVEMDFLKMQRKGGNILYAGLGHSAGAMMNFGVFSRLSKRLRQPPVHCFFSSGLPPHHERKKYSAMTEAEFRTEIDFPPEGLGDEFTKSLFPVLRSDFIAYEQSSQDVTMHLDCPFTLFAAKQDTFEPEVVWSWSRYTSHPVQKIALEGDHLSIIHLPKEMAGHVRDALK